jgi:hypothetical protein
VKRWCSYSSKEEEKKATKEGLNRAREVEGNSNSCRQKVCEDRTGQYDFEREEGRKENDEMNKRRKGLNIWGGIAR